MATRTAFALEAISELNTVRIDVVGGLDLVSSVALDEALRRAAALGPANVVIDLSAVVSCDLTGLRALVRGRAEGALIVDAPPGVQRLLEVAGPRQVLRDDAPARWPAVADAAPRRVGASHAGLPPAGARP